MPNRPITILGICNDHTLILSDHGKTKANPGDTITWHIDNHSGVTSITSILPKAGNPNVFNPDPAPIAHSSNWQGTVDPYIDHEIEEHYVIGYTTASGNFDSDPIISIKPSTGGISLIKLFFIVIGTLFTGFLTFLGISHFWKSLRRKK